MFSKLPRFKETVSDLPPVGAYDVKWLDTSTGPATFDRSGRFQTPQDAPDSNDSSSVDGSSPAPSVTSGPVKPRQSKSKSSTKKKGPLLSDASAAKIAELQKEIRQLITERNDLDSKLTGAKQDIARLEGRLQIAIKDKLSLQAHSASLTKHNHDLLHGHLVKTSSGAQDAKRTAAALSGELDLARQQLELNEEELKRLALEVESSAKQLEEEKSRSEVKTSELAQQLQVANEAKIAVELHNTDLESAKSALEESNQSLEEELSNVQQSLEAKDADLKVVSAELEKHVESEQSLQGQVKELQAFQEKLQGDLDAANKSITDQADRTVLLEQTIASSTQEVLLLRETSSGLERQLASMQDELVKAKSDMERQEKEHLTSVEALTLKCEACEKELAQESRLNRENQAILKAQIISMEVSRKAQDEDSKKLLEDCQTLRAQLSEQEVVNTALKVQVDKLSLEAAEKDEHFRTHLKEVLNINEELKLSKSQQESDLTKQLKLLEEQLHEERQTVLTLQTQLIRDEDSKTSLVEDCQTLRAQLSEQEVVKTALKVQVDKLSLEAAEKDEHFRTHLKEVTEELKLSKSQQESELTQQLKLGDYQNKLQRLEQQLHEERQTVLTLQTQLISAAKVHKDRPAVQGELKSTATQTSAPVDEVVCKTTQVTKSTLEVKRKPQRELESTQGTPAAETQRELKSTQGKLAETQRELKSTQGTLAETQRELKSTQGTLAETQRELKSTQGKLAETQRELKSTQGKLAETQRELKSTQGKLAETQRELESTQGRLAPDIQSTLEGTQALHTVGETRESSDIETRISDLEKEIERLKAENKQLKEDYSILEEKYRPYRDKLDALEELNQLLKSQTALAQSEAEKMSDQYAKLLGHQNSKQKIMHVKKLKEEGAALKLEVTELKSEIARLKRTIKRLEEEGSCVKDPAKALLPKN